MKVVESQQNVACIESSGVLLEPPDLGQVEEQLSPGAVLQHEEELCLALESVVHSDYEWMLDILENPSFCHRVLDLVALDDLSLLEDLHSVEHSVVLFLYEHYLAVGALADDGDGLEVILVDAAGLLLLVMNHVLVLLPELGIFLVYFHPIL